MAIQFQCPQGHLLQGDEAHMGMQSQCPYCGVMFIIPVVDPRMLQATYGQQQPMQYAPQQQAAPPSDEYLPREMLGIDDPTATEPELGQFFDQAASGQMAQVSNPEPTPAARGIDFESPPAEVVEETLLHIPCPNGHELECPYDMLGQEVLCPHCRAQFRLRLEDSREHQAKMQQHDEERGEFWFNWAIAAAVLVGGGLLVLLLVAMSK